MLPVESPFKTYTGLDGKPLDNGYVYFGQPNQNPITAPVTVYWDAAGTQPAKQPLRTESGYIVRAGTPANVFFDGAYSELVRDHKNAQVFYARNSDDFSIATVVSNFIARLLSSAGSPLIGFIQSGVGAVLRTVQAELRERPITPAQFGAVGDGVADDTAALLKTITDGRPVDFGNKTYKHSGLTLTTTGNVHWSGQGASMIYTGASTAYGVTIQAPSGANAENCFVSGISFTGGKAALRIAGQTNTIFSRVTVENCRAHDSALSAFWFYHLDNLHVRGNRAEKAGDVGIYAEFCRNVIVDGNTARNCQGSAGIVVAYGDTVISYGDDTPDLCSNVIITGNVVVVDDDSVPGNYIGGIQVNMIATGKVHGNIIKNAQTTTATDRSMRVGIVISEWVLKDVDVCDNTIVNMFQYGILAGSDPTTEIRRLRVSGNRISRCGLSAMYFERVFEGLEIIDNTVDTCDQYAVYLAATTYDSSVTRNSFRHIGVQNAFASASAVFCAGRNYRIYDNDFYCGADAVVLSSTQPTPAFSVDPSIHTIALFSGGSTQASYNYNKKTFEDIRAWIVAQTGWSATFEHPELGKVDATRILRRTGPRTTAAVNQITVSGFTYMTSAEPQYIVSASGVEGDVRGNRWMSYAIEYADSFDGGRKMFFFGADVLTDTNEFGARTFMAASPAALPSRWYVRGDRVVNNAPAPGASKGSVCTTAGKTGGWTSEGVL